MTNHYGKELLALRQKNGLTQEEMAVRMGLPHRQTLATIEAGIRALAADELIRATEVFGVPLEYFTDRFSVVGEAKFSWRRRSDLPPEEVTAFEEKVGRLFGAYRLLCRYLNEPHGRRDASLNLTPQSEPDDAVRMGEEISAKVAGNAAGGEWLPGAIEGEFGIPVLNLEAPRKLSGAVCHLADMDGVVINQSDAPGRRNFDLAHELFHVLTWSNMPPEHLELVSDEARRGRPNKVEALADAFAAGLLMPLAKLERLPGFGDLPASDDGIIAWLNEAAETLGVSSMALVTRLAAIGRIDDVVRSTVMKSSGIRLNGRETAPPEPLPFGRRFLGVMNKAMHAGRISKRATAGLLWLDLSAMDELFKLHGLEAPPH